MLHDKNVCEINHDIINNNLMSLIITFQKHLTQGKLKEFNKITSIIVKI